MQSYNWAEQHSEKEPGAQEMRLRITQQREAAALERIPKGKLMVLVDRPIGGPLGGSD
jgi:hypothetical protein